VDIRHVLHMNSRACAGPHNRELHGYLHGHCVIKFRERAHNTHLHIVSGILCILTCPREILKNNIQLTRKVRDIEKMCMEMLVTVCSVAGYTIDHSMLHIVLGILPARS
jgi:hypothetical protein